MDKIKGAKLYNFNSELNRDIIDFYPDSKTWKQNHLIKIRVIK